jgi:hypothetical protein
VQFVSFFITARLAAQDTRQTFTEVMLEQLAALTGRELPGVLPEATRDGYLLDLLAQAAETCEQARGRLVLVVDGLDEDGGATTGPGAHSIAGLLPASPPAGMRIIVAGRPNPPIPDDVPDWHPLRDPAIIRPLSASPYAQNVQRLSKQELQRLLRGTSIEQDLLGLLAAARGGLSAPDLAELTSAPLWEIEEILHTVAGRTFTRRPNRWTPKAAPEVYLLGHEELQAAATEYLTSRLPRYLERLHAWAESYRDRKWPAGTPEYLLGGYYQRLVSLGDQRRLAIYGLDRARHDRMLSLTGGDAAALTEIRTALDATATQSDPDLASALALACHRDQLTDRGAHIPLALPVVWAALGHGTRAEALAASITDLSWRARVLAQAADALTQAEEHQQAEAVARSITSPNLQAQALARVAGALTRAGEHQRAEAVARSITNPDLQARILTEVARALTQTGHHRQAETVARSITNPDKRSRALAWVAEALAQSGECEQAGAVAHSITGQGLDTGTLTDVAGALARAGCHRQAEAMARSITDQNLQARALTEVAEALASAGHTTAANQLAALTCTLGRWTNAARAVMSLDENAFVTLEQVLGEG